MGCSFAPSGEACSSDSPVSQHSFFKGILLFGHLFRGPPVSYTPIMPSPFAGFRVLGILGFRA